MKYFLFLSVLLILVGCSREPVIFNGATMGTYYNITIIKTGDSGVDKRLENIQPAIDSVLKEVNMVMSTYIDSSDLSRFNRSADTGWVNADRELIKVFAESKRISAASGGAFDITVGPLVNLWGFGPEHRPTQMPTDSEITARDEITGIEKLKIDADNSRIRKEIPELYCDLSAIAKGYGVDKVGEFLEENGAGNYLVEIGGEVRTRGTNQRNTGWRVGISSADGSVNVKRIIALSDMSIATSGDYRNYFEHDGIRYSHTIDPRTGKPISHRLVSVSVLTPSCMTADGMATALMVLGPEKGFALAKNMNLPVYMIVKDSTGFVDKMTEEFKKFLL